LNLAIYQDEMLAERVRGYRAAIAEAKPLGLSVNNHFACNPATLVLKDDRRACRYGFSGAMFFLKAMVHYYSGTRPVGRINIPRDFLPDDQLDRFMSLRNTSQSQLSAIIGDPASARETVQRFVNVGVDELILVMQTGTTPHEVTMESIRTFAEEVMPHFS
jgi:alkanesulfonate monooxygenase SsuD/methylene tetrahydromethanopterin reductase-like flavin-dependent oxidoreductase (luciferase family)